MYISKNFYNSNLMIFINEIYNKIRKFLFKKKNSE